MSEYANNCGCNNGDAVPIKVNRCSTAAAIRIVLPEFRLL